MLDAELIGEYRSALFLQGLRESSIKTRIDAINKFDTWSHGALSADTTTICRYIFDNKWTTWYRRNVRISLNKFYAWSLATGRVASNPMQTVPKISAPRPNAVPIPTNTLVAEFKVADLTDQAIMALSATEGLRRSEIASLHPNDRRGKLLLVTGKGKRTRKVPLNDTAYALLLRLEEKQGRNSYYFPGRWPNTHLHPTTVYRYWKRHFPDWTLHSGRHRTATVALHRTGNLRAIQEFLGHASLGTTATYLYTNIHDLAAVANAAELQLPPTEPGDQHRVIEIDLEHITPEQIIRVLTAARQIEQRKLHDAQAIA